MRKTLTKAQKERLHEVADNDNRFSTKNERIRSPFLTEKQKAEPEGETTPAEINYLEPGERTIIRLARIVENTLRKTGVVYQYENGGLFILYYLKAEAEEYCELYLQCHEGGMYELSNPSEQDGSAMLVPYRNLMRIISYCMEKYNSLHKFGKLYVRRKLNLNDAQKTELLLLKKLFNKAENKSIPPSHRRKAEKELIAMKFLREDGSLKSEYKNPVHLEMSIWVEENYGY